MKTHTALIEAKLYPRWDNSAFIDYCRYIYNGEKVSTAFLYRSTFPSMHKQWGTLQSILLNMQKHNKETFPIVMNIREFRVGRVEEYI